MGDPLIEILYRSSAPTLDTSKGSASGPLGPVDRGSLWSGTKLGMGVARRFAPKWTLGARRWTKIGANGAVTFGDEAGG